MFFDPQAGNSHRPGLPIYHSGLWGSAGSPSDLHSLFKLRRMEVESVPGRVWLGKISDFISRACAGNNYEAVPLDLPYITWHESSSHSCRVTMSKLCSQVAKLFPICPPGSVLHLSPSCSVPWEAYLHQVPILDSLALRYLDDLANGKTGQI